ncbi:MAG TPA: dihydroxyacetone kinase subunit DhaL [Candidatus Nanopelagicales bacterium]|nr:dihydroxyacetone kinase subunit DhaL [Candidatus Nanopelagicales bacterium]
MTDDLLVRWLTLAGARVAGARERLTDLDAAIGDGDHGINLDRGFRELLRRLESGLLRSDPPGELLEGAGRALIGTVGGASGALYGRGLQRAGAALLAPGVNDAAPLADRPREERAVIAFGAAVDAIAALGRASSGEKTMLDALVPARAAFEAAVDGGATLALATRRAAEAAEAGAEATIPLLATKGRASYLGERSIGHLDPGAASTALLLRALADAVADA